MISSSFLTILLIVPIAVQSKGEWSYENPKKWLRVNRYCGGHLQSPIDLQFNISHYNPHLKTLNLAEQFRAPRELVNDHHTARLELKGQYLLKHVTAENENYIVEQAHFHWGHSNDNNNGSEHLHEGRPYPLEMHVVTYSSSYSSIREAMTNIRGLAVVGVFFEISSEPNPLLDPLIEALENIRVKGQKFAVTEHFDLKALIGVERMSRYYRYDGSLTTPPCYESVIWSVLLEPVKLSLEQLQAFRNLNDENSNLLKNIFRPVQRLGTRKLYRTFLSKDIDEDIQHKASLPGNHGQKMDINVKFIIIIASVLMFAH